MKVFWFFFSKKNRLLYRDGKAAWGYSKKALLF